MDPVTQTLPERFPEEKRAVLRYFLEKSDPRFLGRTARGLSFEVSGNWYYSVTLTFTGADDDPPDNAVWEHAALQENGPDGFLLCCRTDDGEKEGPRFSLPFRGVETVTEYFDGTEQASYGCAPWDRLADCCAGLLDKAADPFTELNGRERELLPLCREIVRLTGSEDGPAAQGFPLLEELAATLHADMLFPRAEALRALRLAEGPDDKHYEKRLQEAEREMNRADTEPIWHAVFRRLKDSQKGFSTDHLQISSSEKYARYQAETARISQYLAENGYTGTYPYFEKDGFPAADRTRISFGEPFRLSRTEEKRFFIRFQPRYYLDAKDVTVDTEAVAGFCPIRDAADNDWHASLFYKEGNWAEWFAADIPLEDLTDRRGRKVRMPGEDAPGRVRQIRGYLEGERKNSPNQIGRFIPPLFLAGFFLLVGLAAFVLVGLLVVLLGSLVLLIAGKGDGIGDMIREFPWGKLLLISLAVCLVSPVVYGIVQRIRSRRDGR